MSLPLGQKKKQKSNVMATRSTFYVDTPTGRDLPSHRHSMLADLSEVPLLPNQDLSSASSSATLPSTAGSVDRLTGINGEKKSRKFFTLKPKSFSLRPFFSSTSIPALASSSNKPASKKLRGSSPIAQRDSSSQTDEKVPRCDEVGVQTLNASTVDVPVQTCSREWEDPGPSYAYRRPFSAGVGAHRFPRWPSAGNSPISSGFLASKPAETASEKPPDAKNSVVSPLVSSRLLKYAAPDDSIAATAKTATVPDGVNNFAQTASSSVDPEKVKSSVPVSIHASFSSVEKSPVISALQPSDDVRKGDDISLKSTSIASSPAKSGDSVEGLDEIANPASEIIVISQPTDRPPSALKIERTDSPVKHSAKIKTVHFDLSDSDSPKCPRKPENPPFDPKNLDKDFEALLRDLDILTDDPIDSCEKTAGGALKSSFKPPSSVPPKQTLLSTKLKSAFDILHQEVLPPILENSNEAFEVEQDIPAISTAENDTLKCDSNAQSDSKTQDLSTLDPYPRSETSYSQGSCPSATTREKTEIKDISQDSSKSASPSTFTHSKLDSNVGNATGSTENVYDNVIKENKLEVVSLPTLPSFFDSSAKITKPTVQPSRAAEEVALCDPFSTTPESLGSSEMLSRSSSRSSIRSNPKFEFDSLSNVEPFDSCGNLNQLEEDIIKSLREPSFDNSRNNEMFSASQDSLTSPMIDAAIMRSNILDRLLTGECDHVIPPSTNTNMNGFSFPISNLPSSQIKFPLSPNTESNFDNIIPPKSHNEAHTRNLSSGTTNLSSHNCSAFLPIQKSDYVTNTLDDLGNMPISKQNSTDFTKQCTVFLLPETNSITTELPELTAPVASVPSTNSYNYNAFPLKDNANEQTQPIADPTIPDSEGCDFTHCLRPSEARNSPFLNKISSSSVSPRLSPERYTAQPTIPKTSASEAKIAVTTENRQPNGQCDYANCLKPSQVQNSMFTAELSELTSNRSNQGVDLRRSNSPLTPRTNTPLNRSPSPMVKKDDHVTPKSKTDEADPPVSHKSEMTIILQSPKVYRSPTPSEGSTEDVTEFAPVYSIKKEPAVFPEPSNKSASFTEQPIPSAPLWPPPPPPPPPTKVTVPVFSSGHSISVNEKPQEISEESHPPPSGSSSVIIELQERLSANRRNSESQKPEIADEDRLINYKVNSDPLSGKETENIAVNNFKSETLFHSPTYTSNGNGGPFTNSTGYSHSHNGKFENFNGNGQHFASKTIITDEPPPAGAVLIDKKVILDGDKVHTDKYYAIPVKEVLKETTSTTKFIPAPPKYDGIGPTEDGIPIGLRNSVKKENMHNWYKTMYKSLHKADTSNDTQEYIIGYSSEPETSSREKVLRKKSSTLDHRSGNPNSKTAESLYRQGYPASAKSSIQVYNVRPRLIEDFLPGESSVTDDEITTGSKRFMPPLNTPKTHYEFNNGYEPENSYTRNLSTSDGPDPEQQKVWYKEIQRGGEIPQFGLGLPAPEKPKDPVIGPLPPPPLNYNGPTVCPQAIRPLTLPSNYQNENSLCQQLNGPYEVQMRQVIHTEMQQRLSPSSSQLSVPTRSILKSPSRSPDLKIPARALFDFKAESSKEMSLTKGDPVLILRQLDKNWYEGEHQGCIGIFPISYVEILPPEHASSPIKSFTEGRGKALFDFIAKTSVELSVRKGEAVNLVRRVDSNWYEACHLGKKGIIPASYLQVLQEPTEKHSLSPLPKSCLKSSRSSSDTREDFSRSTSQSSSPYIISSNSSPYSAENSRTKFQGRSKKGSSLVEPVLYRAIYNYAPQNSDELDLIEGDTIYVVEMCDDGWYVGTSVRTGVFGIFPGNYVERV